MDESLTTGMSEYFEDSETITDYWINFTHVFWDTAHKLNIIERLIELHVYPNRIFRLCREYLI